MVYMNCIFYRCLSNLFLKVLHFWFSLHLPNIAFKIYLWYPFMFKFCGEINLLKEFGDKLYWIGISLRLVKPMYICVLSSVFPDFILWMCQTNVALDVIRKADVSAAIFAPGWVYETKQAPDFKTAQNR